MAPPTYKPLTSAGGITGAPGLPPEIFGAPADVTLDQVIQANALARAQALANQNSELQVQRNEIDVAEKQRQADVQEQIRQAVMRSTNPMTASGFETGEEVPDTLGGGAIDSTFDPNAALQDAQRIALQSGDLDTALNIEKVTKERATNANMPLTEAQRQLFEQEIGAPLPEGTTLRDVTTLSGLQKASTYAQQVNDPLLANNRRLNGILAEQRATGTQVRPPTAAQVAKIGAGDAFLAQMEDMEQRYLPVISENRGVRFLQAAANPNSSEARLYGELNLAGKQAALSLEDRVTDADYKIIQDIITPNDLDTNATILDKMSRLKEFIKRRNQSDLGAMQAGGFNAQGLKDRPSLQIPVVSPTPMGSGSLPRNPDGSALSKEQFMKWKNGGQ